MKTDFDNMNPDHGPEDKGAVLIDFIIAIIIISAIIHLIFK